MGPIVCAPLTRCTDVGTAQSLSNAVLAADQDVVVPKDIGLNQPMVGRLLMRGGLTSVPPRSADVAATSSAKATSGVVARMQRAGLQRPHVLQSRALDTRMPFLRQIGRFAGCVFHGRRCVALRGPWAFNSTPYLFEFVPSSCSIKARCSAICSWRWTAGPCRDPRLVYGSGEHLIARAIVRSTPCPAVPFDSARVIDWMRQANPAANSAGVWVLRRVCWAMADGLHAGERVLDAELCSSTSSCCVRSACLRSR